MDRNAVAKQKSDVSMSQGVQRAAQPRLFRCLAEGVAEPWGKGRQMERCVNVSKRWKGSMLSTTQRYCPRESSHYAVGPGAGESIQDAVAHLHPCWRISVSISSRLSVRGDPTFSI